MSYGGGGGGGSSGGSGAADSTMVSLDGPYAPEPLRAGAGLTSSSSSSSSSLASPASRSDSAAGAFDTVMALDAYEKRRREEGGGAGGVRRRCAHLPEELAAIVLSFLDLAQLVSASKVQRQWRELGADDALWRPLYRRSYGDKLRFDERQSWKFNFRARDLMLSKLGPSIALLAHPDRDRRVESVGFLRKHCEFLKWMLDPPAVHLVLEQQQQQQQQHAPNVDAFPLAVPVAVPQAAPAAATATATALPVAMPVAHVADAPLATAIPVAVNVAAPLAVPVPVAAPLDPTGAAAAAAIANVHPADAAYVAARARVRPAPDLELARMYSRPPRPPPVFSASARPALPARHTAEFVHAQRLVADALVTQGWRRLFPQLVAPHERAQTVTPTVQTAADATALPYASNSFPFPARPARPSARASPSASSTPASASAAASASASASASPACNEAGDASRAMHLCSPAPSPGSFTSSPGDGGGGDASDHVVDADDGDEQEEDEELRYRSPFPHASRAVEQGAVLVAWVEHPWVSFASVSRVLDDIAIQVLARMDSVACDQPVPVAARSLPLHIRLQCLHHVLYTELSFRGNELHYYDVRNSYVHMVLRQRTGIPISLAIVYMAVAERLGIRVRGVNSPGHFLLRVEEGDADTASAMAPTTTGANAASSASHSSAGAGGGAHAEAPVYFVDAFSGNLMSPSVTLNFLAMFLGAGGGGIDASDARRSAQLQSCTHAALFVRMYRNLMNLFQDPRTQQQQQQQQQQRAHAPAVSPLYQMESSLHHCASQILELLRLGGQLSPDVTTAIFIDRFRYASLLAT